MTGQKLDEWVKRMDDHYLNISREQFIEDLKEAGFDVTDDEELGDYRDDSIL